jgi:hypothetical protein
LVAGACTSHKAVTRQTIATTTTVVLEVREVTLRLPGPTQFRAPWREAFHVRYGAADALLGADEGSKPYGPDGGTPFPDGSWWFLDNAKSRIARYDASGRFLGAGPSVGGAQLPVAVDGGWLLAGAGMGRMLVADATTARTLETPGYPLTSDGHAAYGFGEGPTMYVMRVLDGELRTEPADAYRTSAGSRYGVEFHNDVLVVRLLDRQPALELRLHLVSPSGVPVDPAIQFAGDVNGAIHLFFAGDTGAGDSAAYAVIAKDGTVGPVEGLGAPRSRRDPGTGVLLRVIPGTATPAIVVIGEDAVHVYKRDSADSSATSGHLLSPQGDK